ncbi:hypothetical protein NPIL_328431 [Nephila pilipes]|uniref:Uncharacterized protein n=1 Tax=Nephila pilipes TaxID=299642 RepID=A0A8X6NWD4_NEPPI|nr:hypothetical protein NPIL_328431 [Nephila pilipes]
MSRLRLSKSERVETESIHQDQKSRELLAYEQLPGVFLHRKTKPSAIPLGDACPLHEKNAEAPYPPFIAPEAPLA